MTISTVFDAPVIKLQDVIKSITPKRPNFDPLGLVSGYRAYLLYTHLSAKSDNELALMGVTRAELPSVAMDAVFKGREAA
ncbi:hypothetical protein [Roseibium marinum]|uniref:Uncharacterized protein n=1 Tax=Roseibium marinum TaxID=281252 RepID=A0A2S3V3H7_9HYPH|nr:hypothetical protein [Roseibium marinum]POF34508.1 hypothetical protein CLV41_101964 [Roseibium marinum]